MKLEELKQLVEEEKKKPHNKEVRVTRAVTCPTLQIKEYYGINMGKLRHQIIEEKLKSKGLETEVEIALTIDNVLITGHVDALDLNNLTVYEIKPSRIYDNYIRQLSMYVTILRKLTGLNFTGKFIIYVGEEVYELVPPFLDTTILETVLEVLQEETTIKGEYCTLCIHDKKCDKKREWKRKMGFEIAEITKLY
ncbi:putative Cas4 family CRISPR-associated nuclease [Sulfolobus filamentous virus 1]|uniref:Putative Cas4 family CRISPR-associated nuclease n=2 Tax=Alphalipothrixvirus beppuense TaxID=2734584 RepID=A0A346LU97_SUFV1|nr:putative Cas4 family CRISPR-associated nuclease [Sulfolobus filamentous virus 1]AXQ00140.1 putative Cas4 family CRISPR-associated nuclease [Sulfolobus filamentous virus 1]AZI75760.1 putative CRISPR-associated Cas4 nuclease [Sulfolobales Beppu filamentous phage 1]